MGASGARGAAKTAFAIAAVAVGALSAVMCNSPGGGADGAGLPDGGSPDGGIFGSGAPGFGFMCGGASDVAGALPGGAAFSGTLVHSAVIASGCNDPAGSVALVFRDPKTRDQLSVTLSSSVDAGGAALLGAHAVAGAFYEEQRAQQIKTTGTLVVTAADDPRAVLTPDGGPSGSIEGTVSFTHDGLALSGSFSTPYCQESRCSGH